MILNTIDRPLTFMIQYTLIVLFINQSNNLLAGQNTGKTEENKLLYTFEKTSLTSACYMFFFYINKKIKKIVIY